MPAIEGAAPGIYLEFECAPGFEFRVESLEHRGRGIEVVTVRRILSTEDDDASTEHVTVFVPDGALKHFFNLLEKYATETTPKGRRKHEDLVDRIATLRRAAIRELWTDATEPFPLDKNEPIWWEVWLRRTDGRELERLRSYGRLAELTIGARTLVFHNRIVVLVRATPTQLALSLDVLNDLAELRRARESAAVFVDSPADEQAQWVKDLLARTTPPPEGAPVICILDTGVNRGHPLLELVVDPGSAFAIDAAWVTHDDGGGVGCMGHGTQMAGLTAYGDLVGQLASGGSVVLRHRLESVKILPPTGQNRPELYGAITAEAVALTEIGAPNRNRAFSLAVTTRDSRDRGQPTSWSAAIDALAAGRSIDTPTEGLVYLDSGYEPGTRLFIVSAGNVAPHDFAHDHLSRSDVEVVHDPAQAWNALTVGAFTEKTVLDPDWEDWQPLAQPGELSPWSTTSVGFDKRWPTKPDVIFEGGNIAHNATATGFDYPVPALSLLSTHYKPAERMFALSHATSAATAQVARIAGIIRAEYPDLWPETVRALIVHSAEWTHAMRARFDADARRFARLKLLRRYGFGVPNLEVALRSASDSLTLIAQASIRPFANGVMHEMALHALPWPSNELRDLSAADVRLRVTLSYFIEPNPSRRGWNGRYHYASHGLRFEVKEPAESHDEFRRRINRLALEGDERPNTSAEAHRWYLGRAARTSGSVHSDLWHGSAAELAERDVIGVYPVSGWWKEQPRHDRSSAGVRYALVVNVATDAEEVDIWTPVAQQLGILVADVGVEW